MHHDLPMLLFLIFIVNGRIQNVFRLLINIYRAPTMSQELGEALETQK